MHDLQELGWDAWVAVLLQRAEWKEQKDACLFEMILSELKVRMSIECFKKFWKHVVFSRNIRVWWDNKYHSSLKTHCSLPPILSPLLWTFFWVRFFCQANTFPLWESGPLRRDSDNNGRWGPTDALRPSDPPAPSLSFAFSILDTIGMANHLHEIYPQTENNGTFNFSLQENNNNQL